MFQWLTNAVSAVVSLLGGGARPGGTVRAAYDSAATTDENARHWLNADSLSPLWSADPLTRKTIRERARYEACENNGLAKGMVDTYIDDLIGRGPRLQLLTRWRRINQRVERRVGEWMEDIELAHKLRVLGRAKKVDGESFGHLFTDPDLPAVQLNLQLSECDYFGSPLYGHNWYIVDGVEYDERGRPVAYHRLREHPGGGFALVPALTSDRLPAEQVIHLYRELRAGQVRGVSEIAPALPLFAILRRYTLAALLKEENAANVTGVIQTTSSNIEAVANDDPFGSIDTIRGALMHLPDGWGVHQFRSEQNATTYSAFKTEILKEAARCLNMPYNVAACDSSKHNFASGRLDHLPYFRALRTEQQEIERRVLDRLLLAWWREAALIPGFLPEELQRYARAGRLPPHRWFWDTNTTIDPEKEAKANAQGLANHTVTLAELCAARGQDWENVLRQRGREIAMQRALDIYVQPAGTPVVDEPESSAEQDQEHEATV